MKLAHTQHDKQACRQEVQVFPLTREAQLYCGLVERAGNGRRGDRVNPQWMNVW